MSIRALSMASKGVLTPYQPQGEILWRGEDSELLKPKILVKRVEEEYVKTKTKMSESSIVVKCVSTSNGNGD